MISNLENAMAKQTEQATVQATGMESINNGMKPQGIATPDSCLLYTSPSPRDA